MKLHYSFPEPKNGPLARVFSEEINVLINAVMFRKPLWQTREKNCKIELLHHFVLTNIAKILSRIWVAWLLDGVWIGRFDSLHVYTQLGGTSNTALKLIYTLHSSPLHTHTTFPSLQQSYPGNGFQHSNYTRLSVTAAHMKCSLHSLIPFLLSLLSPNIFDCHLKRPLDSISVGFGF
jgi:hypothetical protein